MSKFDHRRCIADVFLVLTFIHRPSRVGPWNLFLETEIVARTGPGPIVEEDLRVGSEAHVYSKGGFGYTSHLSP